MTAADANLVTVCASAKGGQGCTTIAAVLAGLAAHTHQPALLLDTRGDAAATLGVADSPPASTFAEAITNAAEPCCGLRVATLAGDGIDADAIAAISELVAAGIVSSWTPAPITTCCTDSTRSTRDAYW